MSWTSSTFLSGEGENVTSHEQKVWEISGEIENDIDKVLDVFLEMQKLVPLLKSDMASIIGVAITNQDNDGD